MHIRHFLASCLFALGSWFASLGERFDHMLDASLDRIGDLWHIAFPPDPNKVLAHQHYERALAEDRQRRKDSRFADFMSRAGLHEQFSGGGFRLDTVSRLT